MKLLDPEALRRLLAVLPRQVSQVGVFLAGCATEQDRHRLEEIASSIWPDAAIRVGSDRESGFAAAFGNGRRDRCYRRDGFRGHGPKGREAKTARADGAIFSAIAEAATTSPFAPCGGCYSILILAAASRLWRATFFAP